LEVKIIFVPKFFNYNICLKAFRKFTKINTQQAENLRIKELETIVDERIREKNVSFCNNPR
jgi:hypothetical protein